MRYCESCGAQRRHAHFTDEGTRYNFCRRCRKKGFGARTECGWCGDSRSRVNRYCDSNNHPVPDDTQDRDWDDSEDFEDDMGTIAVSDENTSKARHADSRSLVESTRWTRRQCSDCDAAFDYVSEYERHLEDNEFVCEEHRACLGGKDVWDHAREERHDRCFLSICTSKYRKNPNWSDREIEDHIWFEHVKSPTVQRR